MEDRQKISVYTGNTEKREHTSMFLAGSRTLGLCRLRSRPALNCADTGIGPHNLLAFLFYSVRKVTVGRTIQVRFPIGTGILFFATTSRTALEFVQSIQWMMALKAAEA
jgi:hypothetical protein